MSTPIMVMAHSGAGKSSSLRNVDPQTSFLLQAIRKPLPFKGARENWKEVTKGPDNQTTGNVMVTDDPEAMRKYMWAISERRPEIKNIFIDDSQYVMANEYMRSATEKGYDKFTRIGQGFWMLVADSAKLRPDLTVTFLHHSDTSDSGEVKAKTIGKMLDNAITLEGMFTIVLRAAVRDGKHVFLTQNSGHDTVKAPMGMFEDAQIENDMNLVLDAVANY